MTVDEALTTIERQALSWCEVRNDLRGYAEIQQAAKTIRDELLKEECKPMEEQACRQKRMKTS